MDIKLKAGLVLIIFILSLVTGCHLSGATVGNIAPDFTLADLDGDTVNLSDLRGIPVMLNFWATWCGPCRNEMPYIQEIYEQWQDRGLVIFAINEGEDFPKVYQFMQSNNLSFPVLLDTNGNVSSKYEIRGIPTTLFIDEDGIIQGRRIGSFANSAEIEKYLDLIIP